MIFIPAQSLYETAINFAYTLSLVTPVYITVFIIAYTAAHTVVYIIMHIVILR